MQQLPLFYEGTPIRKDPGGGVVRKVGNTKLVQHGIFEDKSDYRIHVGSIHAYVFETALMAQRCKANNYRVAKAYQQGLVTAEGLLVRISEISDLQKVAIPELLKRAQRWPPAKDERLGVVGAMAEAIAKTMITDALIVFPRILTAESRLNQQYQGVDLVQKEREVIYQVKSDLRVDETKNLFIQTHECNPFGEH